MQVSRISVYNCQPKTRVASSSAMSNNNAEFNKTLQADELSFKSKKIRTATSIITGFAGGVIGFCVGGPGGAVIGAGIGAGSGYAMESDDDKSSTGDANFSDKRD